MTRFYGFIQPQTGWLYDHKDDYWVQVAYGKTYDLAREETLRVIRKMNRGKEDPIVYVISIRSLGDTSTGA